MATIDHFRTIWLVDFEFTAPAGECPTPLCVVAHEWRTGWTVRQWLADGAGGTPPYDVGPESLLVAYYSSAEWGCHLAMDWPMPSRVLDLFTEFRALTNGQALPHGRSLLGAMTHYGLPALDAAEKDEMRKLAMRGGEYSESERSALLSYCESDVQSLAKLLPAMLPAIDLPRALLRGRYMTAAAAMEFRGIPIDTERLLQLRTHWETVKTRLTDAIDPNGDIYTPALRIDPESTGGANLFQAAEDYGVNRFTLAAAVEDLHEQEREAIKDQREAIQAARKVTGITFEKACKWEGDGHDYASWPGLDVTARSLAGEYPALNIGEGYSSATGVDDNDYAARLWELLRQPDPTAGRKFDNDRVRRAAQLVSDSGDGHRLSGPRAFSVERFTHFLVDRGIAWPRLESGALALDRETFRERAKLYPESIGPIRELKHARDELRSIDLTVGADGRNRCLLSAFSSRTGRNQPSNSRFVFGFAVWLRSLIQPMEGRALAYVDWSGQEYAIAAALSNDANMIADYLSGDPYLAFGRRINAVPMGATKKTHAHERDCLKVACGLGALYGAGPDTVANVLGVAKFQAREWLAAHRRVYRDYWRWSDAIVDHAMLTGRMQTCFGWPLQITAETKGRSLRNFPMQSHGAEMMRLAACLAVEQGIEVCAPIHDAFLIEADDAAIDAETERMQAIMEQAAALVIPGLKMRTDAKIIRHPDRFSDPRGDAFWEKVTAILDELTAEAALDVSGEMAW